MKVNCPHCGEEIDHNATFCRHCGSDESTGWASGAGEGAIDWQDDEDYADAVQREFGHSIPDGNKKIASPIRLPNNTQLWVAIVSAMILFSFLVWFLRNLF